MRLDPNKVPKALIPLVPFAERWGIGDDFEREHALGAATTGELEALVQSVDEVGNKEFYEWLAGPLSYDPRPTEEHLAFSNLNMAIEFAKVELRQRKRT